MSTTGQIDADASRSFLFDEFEKMGIDPERDADEFNRFQRSLFSWADFAEYWFRHPEDEDEPLILENAQRNAIDAIQFGYPINDYPWVIPENKRPKEVIMIWPRQYGKTTAVAIAAACAFIFMQKRFRIGTFSINLDGAVELLDRIKVFIEFSPFAWMIENSNTTTLRKVGDKVKLTAYPMAESVRGRSLHLGLIDEASRCPDVVLDGAVMKTLRRAGKRWILLSTPRGYKGLFIKHFQIGINTRPIVCLSCGESFEQESDLMKRWIPSFRDQQTMFNIPENLPACPVCFNRNWTYGVGEYTVVPVDPWNSRWITAEELRKELDLAGWTPLARQELLGEIIFEGSNVFSKAMLENAVNQKLDNIPLVDPNVHNYVIGMDFGKVHDASVLNVMHYDRQRGKAIWDHMMTMGGQFDKVDYTTIRRDFIKLVLLYNPIWIIPDATGVGDSIVDEMWEDLKKIKRQRPYLKTKIYSNQGRKNASGQVVQSQFKAQKKKGFHFTHDSKVDLIDNLVMGYRKRCDIEIPPYNVPEAKQFWDEMLAFTYEVTENQRIKYGVQNAHDDRVIAHALAYYVVRQHPFVSCSSVLGD